RVLVMIEDLAPNQPFTEKTAKGLSLRMYSSRGSYRIPVSITQTQNGLILVSFSRFKNMPAILLVKALGIIKDSDIASFIGNESDVTMLNLYEYAKIQDADNALMAIAEHMNLQG
ncbi:MAG: hypothetical protein COS89_08175, partial [Deltaproteobacteria bacterium CG07_land_8_20_14_0_80_38_7]